MTFKAAVGCLIVFYLAQVVSQTTPSGESTYSSTSTINATCGAGSNSCPTEETSGASEVTVTQPISTDSPTSTTAKTTVPNETLTTLEVGPTTSKQKDLITTPVPPTILPEVHHAPEKQDIGYTLGGVCGCDLTAFSCDINCCCDPECTFQNRLSFSHCESHGYQSYDNRYCHVSKLIFLNNSQHILQQTQNGVFCIVRSNLAGSVLYPVHPIFVTPQAFSKQWERSLSPNWPDLSPATLPLLDKPSPYLTGSALWTFLENQLQLLDLQSAGLTNACSTKKPVRYLVPWSSHCSYKAPSTKAECDSVSTHVYNQIKSVVSSPLQVNQTELLSEKVKHCPGSICVPATYYVCSHSVPQQKYLSSCKNATHSRILFGLKSGVCYGVMRRLKLLFYHKGTEGLDHVEAFMWLSNISQSNYPLHVPLYLEHTVDFKWAVLNTSAQENLINKTNFNGQNLTSRIAHIPFMRSGNPGYLVGRPVISGFRVTNKINSNGSRGMFEETESSSTKQDVIQLSHDPKQWMSLPGSNFEGMCDWSDTMRQSVTFGEDMHLSCGLSILPSNVSSLNSCNNFRNKMLQLLLGDASNAFYNNSFQSDWGRVVAAYGSANVSRQEEWVPLLLEYQPPFLFPGQFSTTDSKTTTLKDTDELANDKPLQTCESVPLGVTIQIMHAFVGPTSNPQSKILGASLRFSPVQDISLVCPSVICFEKGSSLYLRVVSSVKFVDISSPAVTRYAEPPAIHIRLPPDFFYPFMAAEGSSSKSVLPLPSLFLVFVPVFVKFLG